VRKVRASLSDRILLILEEVPTRGVVYVSQVVDLTGSRRASGIAERKDLGKNFPELKTPFTALDVQDAIGHYAHSASPLLSLQPVVEMGFCSSDRRLRSKWARKPKAIARRRSSSAGFKTLSSRPQVAVTLCELEYQVVGNLA
jgi:hypothetical protein